MTLADFGNVVWTIYNGGKLKSTQISLSEQKVVAYCKTAYANVIRTLWMKGGNQFYFFTSNALEKKFSLPESDMNGRRFIDMNGSPTIALPMNSDVFNIIPINKAGNQQLKEVTLVQPAEESFYKGLNIPYGAKRANGVMTYFIPPCVEEVNVYAVYDDVTLDVPQDILFDVSRVVLNLLFDIRKFPQRGVDDKSTVEQELLKIQKGQVESLP